MPDFSLILPLLLTLLAVLLALSGIALSALDISGTWLVAAAALVLHFASPQASGEGLRHVVTLASPSWTTIVIAFLLCLAVDLFELFAARWGVLRRGGSPRAGCAAFVGTLLGAFLGGIFLPFPPFGSIIGMFLLAYLLVYLVERPRWQSTDPSRPARIARGALLATAASWFLKLTLSISLSVYLLLFAR